MTKLPRLLSPLVAVITLSMLAGPLAFTPAVQAQMARETTKAAAFPDFDIRVGATMTPAPATAGQRPGNRALASAAARAEAIAGQLRAMGTARADLAARVPGLQVENGRFDRSTPEIVATSGGVGFLTTDAPDRPHEETARGFLTDHAALYGLSATQAAGLVKFADYSNPQGGMSWVEFRQEIAGIPVFQGEIRFAFTPGGALARTVGNLAPALDDAALSALAATPPALDPAAAAVRAAASIGRRDLNPDALRVQTTTADGRVATLAPGPFVRPVIAEKLFFATEAGVATLAYQIILWERDLAYLVLVDSQDGTLLFRKCLTQEQSQSASYRVYTSDSPAPLSPTTALPGQNIQAPGVPTSLVSLIADDLTASPLGWITDGGNTTKGNNVTAGLDIDGINGVDSNVTGSGTRVFDFSYSPAPLNGNPDAGEAPNLAAYRNGVVTNLFFWTNRYHDRLYQLGFTEQARNFQTLNVFTINGTVTNRGGVANDAISAEAQDSSGTNNANFSTTPDGVSGRMQMYLFTTPSPQRDGSLDGDVFLHEMTHGTSNRIHANGTGLATTMSGGMGEGWSDFYARGILATADEDVNGVFASGAYVTYKLGSATNNYYYGIRRFPYAVLANVGGASATRPGRPHNPLTFADVDPAQINLNDGAYAPNPLFAANAANEVHNIGEVWCMMLLEFRARVINRLGFTVGNQRALQIVTDGMKMDPTSPTIVQGRNSLIDAATAANPGAVGAADAADVRVAFAARGCGAGASTNGTAVVESFYPDVVPGTVTFSDSLGNNNGYPEAGEDLVITLPLTNPGTTSASPVSASAGNYTAAYGTINAGTTVSRTIAYRVPANTACGALLSIPIVITGPSAPVTYNYPLRVGRPIATSTFSETFSGTTLPTGWTNAIASGTTVGWAVSTTVIDAGNCVLAPDPATVTDASLVSPSFTPGTGPQVSFRHRYTLETNFDGGVLEISVNGGAYQDLVTAGGAFTANGYSGAISTQYGNPLGGRAAWTGTLATTATVTANLPASVVGLPTRLRWRLGTDNSTSGTGWYVDTVNVTSTTYACASIDADGDGIPDGYELANGQNPNDSSDARLDSDGDGVSNLDEYRAGTDPRDAKSLLRILGETRDTTTGVVTFTFPTVNGRTYRAEVNPDLTNPAGWTVLQDNIAGTGAPVPVQDAGATGQPQRFYRVRVTGP